MPVRRSKTGRILIEGDPLIFRFKCTWEESEGGGETRQLVLIFYREDDTLELRENHDVNCGRYKAPIFLKRGRYLKEDSYDALPPPGFREDRILLNVVRSRGPGKLRDNYLKDNVDDSAAKKKAYFAEEDFFVGKSLRIEGRDIMLIDCDPATREYFKKAHSREMEKIEIHHPMSKEIRKEVPPYNGFGDEDDSLTSCGGLEPRPPRKDFQKFMSKDRIGLNSHVLRFEARELNGDPQTKYVISFYLLDDSISVSQIVNDKPIKFLKKGRIKHDCGGAFYGPSDFYVGVTVVFYGHEFLLISADEYVYDYMESESESFPKSNLRLILQNLSDQLGPKGIKALMAEFLSHDPHGNEVLNEKTFREVIDSVTRKGLSEHEMMTIIRSYKSAEESQCSGEQCKLFSILQAELKKIHYTGFNELLLCLKDRDTEATGILDRDSLHSGILAAIITHSQSRSFSIRSILDRCLSSFRDNDINYEEVVKKMNWARFPAKPVPPQFVSDNRTRCFSNPIIYRSISYYDLIKTLEMRE